MKKLILAAAVAAFASSAMATDANHGTVHFKGKVTDQTCTIKTESQDQTVLLNTVPASVLDSATKTAMPTPFDIKLENCNETIAGNTVGKVKAFFTSANLDSANAYTLKNTATSNQAENVNIQLTNTDGSAITPSAAGSVNIRGEAGNGVADNVKAETITAREMTLHYKAQYYATAAAKPGDVTSSVDFIIAYE